MLRARVRVVVDRCVAAAQIVIVARVERKGTLVRLVVPLFIGVSTVV